jgi:hypothetical protein
MSSTGWIAAVGCSERTSGDSLNVDETLASAEDGCQHSYPKFFESFAHRQSVKRLEALLARGYGNCNGLLIESWRGAYSS